MHLKNMLRGAIVLFLFVLSWLRPCLADNSFSVMESQFGTLYQKDTLQKPDITKLNSLVEGFLEHSHCENCFFKDKALLLAARLHLKKFSALSHNASIIKALDLYQQIEKQFPQSAFIDEVILEKGDAFLLLGERDKARAQYTKLILEQGASTLMKLAQEKLLALEPIENDLIFDEPPEDISNIRASVKLPGKKALIVLDPGHGGDDAGARGPHGLAEKDVVLDVAKRLKRKLEMQGHVVELTREDDTFIPLGERTALANKLGASLFVSLHVNASPAGRASGYQTFYLDNTDDAASKRLAERENGFSEHPDEDTDMAFIVSDLIQNGKLKDSIILANLIHRYVMESVSQGWTNVHDLGIRKGPFFVLVKAHMPCVLAELFFIDNKRDNARLRMESFRDELVNGLFLGISHYLDRKQG